jgi:hypothetical protein
MEVIHVTTENGKPVLHYPRKYLHPNKISGAHIISELCMLPRLELIITEETRNLPTKVYKRGFHYYVCPGRGDAPPKGRTWEEVGKKHGRYVYKAIGI